MRFMKHHRRIPRKPLEDVLFFVNTAQKLILRLHNDKLYIPDDYDFALLEKISDVSQRLRLMVSNTEISFHLRAKHIPDSPSPKG
jgi:hypothetical protein